MAHASPEVDVRHEHRGGKGAFFVEIGGVRLAAMTYTRAGDDKVIVEHTEVADVLRGQGVGLALLHGVVDWARQEGLRVIPLCPFARAMFAREPGIADVLAG